MDESAPFGILPILLIFALVCYPVEIAYLSETSLGKFFCVTLILFYGIDEPIYGAFVCALVVMYYHFGHLEHILSIHRNQLLQESMALMNQSLATDIQTSAVTPEILYNLESYTTRDAGVFAYEPHAVDMTRDESILLDKDPKGELKAAFRKENCKNGRLNVNNELAEHVAFPLSGTSVSTIKFNNDFAKCNPCDPNCGFSIVEEKLLVEDALTSPNDSHQYGGEFDWFKDVDFRPFDSMADDFKRWSGEVQQLSNMMFA